MKRDMNKPTDHDWPTILRRLISIYGTLAGVHRELQRRIIRDINYNTLRVILNKKVWKPGSEPAHSVGAGLLEMLAQFEAPRELTLAELIVQKRDLEAKINAAYIKQANKAAEADHGRR